MPNLVGTGLNQVPINGMLGGLAYQDPEHASIKNLDLKNLSQINSEIADTATAVFVYDTRKDSDGGAWRKKTQNTSWYNETLNTQYRGSRREFPAVAVIVGIQWGIKIYDGDDPDLPLWAYYKRLSWDRDVNSIAARDGKICFTIRTTNSYSGNGFGILDYVKDRQSRNYIGGYSNFKNGFANDLIASKRENTTYLTIGTNTREFTLIDYNANDVAMTVLPNAPIDPSTGLPVPTIAVGTEGGLSVITDSGSVFDDVTSAGMVAGVESCAFSGTKIVCCRGGASGNKVYVQDASTISADFTSERMYRVSQYGETNEVQHVCHNLADIDEVEGSDDNLILGAEEGIAIINENLESPTNGLVAKIRADYNTGWMHGNNKGAFLSDIDTTNKTNGQTDPDRSISNLALTVTGTVTKTAVATGADLVAYSGFSNSANYMDNTSYSINFGNPPTISIMFWQKITDIADYSYGVSFSAGNTIKGGMSNGASSAPYAGQSYFFMGSETLFTGVVTNDGNWHCLVGTISGNAKKFYLDGREVASTTINNHDMSGISRIHVGSYGTTHVYAHRGSLALLRVSKSVPSAEQIKKMFEEEKVLFQENAKATLYGSSNAVTALAFDDTTNLLHVGTSAGRSEFQGLRRINNTTDAVTTAISASNGLVSEQ